MFVQPADGATRRFPSVAYDSTHDAYLVTWGIGTPTARTAPPIGARFVSAGGTPLGSSVAVNTTGVSPQVDGAGAACSALACLVAWVEEPATIAGRLLRYNNGSVEFLGDQFVINQNGFLKLSTVAPSVTYSPVANEFLVLWSEITTTPDVKAQRVSGSGLLQGPEIVVAGTGYWEGFGSAAYNSAQNEYIVAYYLEASTSSNVAMQRIQPGTGALIGGRNTIYGSWFDQYPEIAYNSQRNQYFMITWGWTPTNDAWMLHGRLADISAQPLGAVLSLAFQAGGNGLGLAYNPVSNTYFCVYQSQKNDEVWGVVVTADGLPGSQFQVTVSGTKLSSQPRAAASWGSARWLSVASEGYLQVMGQLVDYDPNATPPPPSSACTTPQPGTDWTCVNGNWVPPGTTTTTTSTCTTPSPGTGWTCVNGNWQYPSTTTTTTTSTCTTPQPGTGWTCVNGNWQYPSTTTTTTSTCTTPQPGTGWTCVNGNWQYPSTTTTTTSSCTTPQPGTGWTCVNGNWLPPTTTPAATSSCTTPQPGTGWTCVNGNWLPPTTTTTAALSCTTPQPGTGWTCVNGNWLPPTASLVIPPGSDWTLRERLSAATRGRLYLALGSAADGVGRGVPRQAVSV